MFARAAMRPGPDVDWEEFLTGFQGAPGIMLMVAEETPFEFGQVAPLLRELDAEVFGGVFPGGHLRRPLVQVRGGRLRVHTPCPRPAVQ